MPKPSITGFSCAGWPALGLWCQGKDITNDLNDWKTDSLWEHVAFPRIDYLF